MKKWIKMICLVMTVISVISMMSMTAFAATDDVIDESFSGVEIPAEELTEGGETVTMPDETTAPVPPADSPRPPALTATRTAVPPCRRR